MLAYVSIGFLAINRAFAVVLPFCKRDVCNCALIILSKQIYYGVSRRNLRLTWQEPAGPVVSRGISGAIRVGRTGDLDHCP